MAVANIRTYMEDIVKEMRTMWPNNHTINIVCHGHSVPAGYFAENVVDTFNAYPHIFHTLLKARFPLAVINVIVTAIAGENCISGAERFERFVLRHGPEVVTIDYALNDRWMTLKESETAWRAMVEKALARNCKVILLTPTADVSGIEDSSAPDWISLLEHAQQIRNLADEYRIGLVDSFKAYENYARLNGDITDMLSSINHPNRKGHEIVANEMVRWFSIMNLDT